MAVVLGLMVGASVAWILARMMFGSYEAWKEAAEFWYQSEFVSLIFGELKKDLIAELRFLVWFGLSAGAGWLTYSALS